MTLLPRQPCGALFGCETGALMTLCADGRAQVEVGLQRIASGISSPTYVAQPPGVTRWLYYTLQSGSVGVIRDGVRLTTPVLSLQGVVSGPESGLLGLAFHPHF